MIERFITERMEMVFEDLQDSLSEMERLCPLKDLRFDAGNLPDYSNPVLCQLYLLRFFYAYLFEYYKIYMKILKDPDVQFPLGVLSVGCGSGLDYFGLYLAYCERFDEHTFSERVQYTGLDRIKWKYRDKLDNPNCFFIDEDIMEWDALDEDDYNVIIFPKSIGEFDQETFKHVVTIFKNSSFADTCYLISSSRESSDTDKERFEALVTVLVEHGFEPKFDRRMYWFFNDKGIRAIERDFLFPQEIIEFVKTLSENCPTFIEKGQYCEDACRQILNRMPILRAGHIRYQLQKLTK